MSNNGIETIQNDVVIKDLKLSMDKATHTKNGGILADKVME